jgi:hypothetical protein
MVMRGFSMRYLPLLIVLALLTALYISTLQTIPNGSDHYFMIDVGETQIVLNVWGTLHATGYPLYVISGALITNLLTALGVSPVVAPALVSLLWGVIALALVYALALRLTGRALLSAAVMAACGLTLTVWIHQVIAEVYSFGLLINALLLLIALWRGQIRHRVYWLALIGGIGVAHHRAVVMMIPALLYAAWPHLTGEPRRLPRLLVISLLLGCVGFLQYLYLPLQAWRGAPWVYGEPGTLAGLWDQFIGTEAAQFIGRPPSLWDNFALINTVLMTDLTLPGLLAGIGGLVIGLLRHRRAAITLILSGLVSYLFHVFVYSDVLSALILQITLSLAFGWLFLGDWLLARYRQIAPVVAGALLALLSALLIAGHHPFIRSLIDNETGLETIEMARQAPPDSTLMIAWGTRHFAVGFARDVLGDLQHLTLVDHKADFAALLAQGVLITPAYTFYERPLGWWQDQIGAPVYLRTAAPGLVQIDTQPQLEPPAALCARLNIDDCAGVVAAAVAVTCAPDTLTLAVDWAALSQPEQDLSVFVHLVDAAGGLLAQADQSAPVYGWYPLRRWQPGEIVRDLYLLPRHPAADHIRYGLYHQLAGGAFENVYAQSALVDCAAP